jgi:serine/threonine protein kinase
LALRWHYLETNDQG